MLATTSSLKKFGGVAILPEAHEWGPVGGGIQVSYAQTLGGWRNGFACFQCPLAILGGRCQLTGLGCPGRKA